MAKKTKRTKKPVVTNVTIVETTNGSQYGDRDVLVSVHKQGSTITMHDGNVDTYDTACDIMANATKGEVVLIYRPECQNSIKIEKTLLLAIAEKLK